MKTYRHWGCRDCRYCEEKAGKLKAFFLSLVTGAFFYWLTLNL